MKNISTIILAATMAFAAGQVAAADPVITHPPAPPPPSIKAPTPVPPAIKDFRAARDLELERSKFQLGALEQYRKCLTVARDAAAITACKTSQHDALTKNMASLREQGKFAAAYDQPVAPGQNPLVVPAK